MAQTRIGWSVAVGLGLSALGGFGLWLLARRVMTRPLDLVKLPPTPAVGPGAGAVERWAAMRDTDVIEALNLHPDRYNATGDGQTAYGPMAHVARDIGVEAWNKEKLAGLHPDARSRVESHLRKAREAARLWGWDVVIMEGQRTVMRQLQTLRSGASKTIASLHLLGLAADLVAWHPGNQSLQPSWNPLGAGWWRDNIAARAAEDGLLSGMLWEYDWKDPPHVELRRELVPVRALDVLNQVREEHRRVSAQGALVVAEVVV